MDYRFFPEPDLPELQISPSELAEARSSLPELPWERERRYQETLGLSPFEAAALLQSPAFAEAFEAVARASGHPRTAAHWMLGEVSRVLNARGCTWEELHLDPLTLGELVRMVQAGVVNQRTAREEIFPALLSGETDLEGIIASRGLRQVSDRGEVEALVREVLAANPGPLSQWRAGNAKLRAFLVGQVMKAGQGRLNPQVINEVLDAVAAE